MNNNRPRNISTDPDNLTWDQIRKIVDQLYRAGCKRYVDTYSAVTAYTQKYELTTKDTALVQIMMKRHIASMPAPWLNGN